LHLHRIFEQIESWYGLDAKRLAGYASEDLLLGGVEGNPFGTSYAVDGNLLYALVRELKPKRILEIGTDHGGSALHMASACKRNQQGHIWTVDINPDSGDGLINDDARWITQIIADASPWVADYDGEPFDFIFEDGAHSEYQVHVVYENLPRILKPGGFILSHDVSTGVGEAVLNGIRKGGADMDHVHIVTPDPSPLGFSIYRYDTETYEVTK
jgi:predicted O-methyltransferase YrrM